MFTTSSITNEVREFVASNFLYGQDRKFSDADSFLGEGIIDSTGVLQLVSFLEETYGITVEDEELRPDNLDSVSSVTAFLARKLSLASETGSSAARTYFREN